MITYPLPKKIRYIPATGIFTATFNVPTLGKYDFAGQSIVFIPKMQANSIYLIDAFSIGGNIANEDYLDAIDTVPVLTVRKSYAGGEAIFQPIPITGYSTDRQIVHFFKTGSDNCGLNATIAGALKQTAMLVGVASVSLTVNFSIHLIEDSGYEKQFIRGV